MQFLDQLLPRRYSVVCDCPCHAKAGTSTWSVWVTSSIDTYGYFCTDCLLDVLTSGVRLLVQLLPEEDSRV